MDRNKKKEDAADQTVVVSSLSADVQKEEVISNTTNESQDANCNFYQDFFGFSSEEWSRKISHKDSPLQQQQQQERPVYVRKKRVGKKGDKEITNPIFRSKSVSFKYMRFKIGSSSSAAMGTKRSKSVPALASNSRSKSRWQVFMSGFGSGRFPTKMDLVDIKSRQLRHDSKTNQVLTQDVVDHHVNTKGESTSGGGKTSGSTNTLWWRLVDVLGCGRGRYATDIKQVVV